MSTFYDEVGGEPFFLDLVSQFYARVATNEILRPMYPESDMKGAAQRLVMFLEQYWGGPSTYSEVRGHPRLRMRHAGFHIDTAARDAWLSCMLDAMALMEMDQEHREQLSNYFEMAAHSMVNQPEV